MEFQFSPIAVVRSCFKEKFGIPRQPGLVAEARGVITMLPPNDRETAVRGLDDFSHIWVLFGFHGLSGNRDRSTVRPPRLGGNRRMGVFATRSGFRPNPIGLSVLTLLSVEIDSRGVRLHVGGLDLLDGTPVLDIKPYLPYADCVTEASGGFAHPGPPADLPVTFSPEAEAFCRDYTAQHQKPMAALIARLLALDPRPAYARSANTSRIHGFRLLDVDVRWKAADGGFHVVEIRPIDS